MSKQFVALTLILLVWGLSAGFVAPLSDAQVPYIPLSDNAPSNDEFLLKGVDGPYIFKKRNKIREVRVVASSEKYEIEEYTHDANKNPTFVCEVENEDRDVFSFQLMKKISRPRSTFKQPSKLLAISDIEGNFNAFYSLLVGNGVMNKAYEWTYGEGHLVLVGDFVDRGTNVTQCLWLIYKLEQEAKKQGGMVHFILGNHEVMNFEGTTAYVDHKYIALAHKISKDTDTKEAYKDLMSNKRELVKWMKSKNVMERIGRTIFVHGGLSPQLPSTNLSISELNMFMRIHIDETLFVNDSEKQLFAFLMGPLGPLWYRGMVGRYKKIYAKATPTEVKKTLKFYQADQVVIGHTVANNVFSDYDGMVYRTDISFPLKKFTGRAQGLLIENDQFFRVNDLGEKVKLN